MGKKNRAKKISEKVKEDVVIVEEPKPEPPVSAAPPSELSSREQGERVSAI